MKKDKKFISRKFLNKDSGLACIQVESVVSDWHLESSLSIHDCSRSINIDFSVYEANEYPKSMAKINLIIDELTKLANFMNNNIEEYKDRNGKVIERRKAFNKPTTSSDILGLLDE